jgi:hypothetical protein
MFRLYATPSPVHSYSLLRSVEMLLHQSSSASAQKPLIRFGRFDDFRAARRFTRPRNLSPLSRRAKPAICLLSHIAADAGRFFDSSPCLQLQTPLPQLRQIETPPPRTVPLFDLPPSAWSPELNRHSRSAFPALCFLHTQQMLLHLPQRIARQLRHLHKSPRAFERSQLFSTPRL